MNLLFKACALILLSVGFSNVVFSQTKKKVFYDKDWKPATASSAEYFRILSLNGGGVAEPLIKDYYVTGELRAIGNSTSVSLDDGNKLVRDGIWRWFHKNGMVASEATYSAGIVNGPLLQFFPSGQLKSRAVFKNGKVEGGILTFSETGDIDTFFDEDAFDEPAPDSWLYVRCRKNGPCVRTFSENFSEAEAKNIWYVSPNSSFKDGLLVKDNSELFTHIRLPYNKALGLSFGVTSTRRSGREGWSGIIFGYKDADNYNAFLLSANGKYLVYRKVGGTAETIQPWTRSSMINQGHVSNQMKIDRSGKDTEFYVNDELVFTSNALVFYGDTIGLNSYDATTGETLFTDFFASQAAVKPRYEAPATVDPWKSGSTGLLFHKSGLILTTLGNLADMASIETGIVVGADLVFFKCSIALSDPESNLAILRISDPKFKIGADLPFKLMSDSPIVGLTAFSMGYPPSLTAAKNGNEISAAQGSVEGFKESGAVISRMTLATPLQPFTPGSPVFNEKGEILGIGLTATPMITEIASPAIIGRVISKLGEKLSTKAKTISFNTEADVMRQTANQIVLIRGR